MKEAQTIANKTGEKRGHKRKQDGTRGQRGHKMLREDIGGHTRTHEDARGNKRTHKKTGQDSGKSTTLKVV